MNILFMCVANSARSQLAEALAKKILGEKFNIQSAGSAPSKVNPFAIQVLKEEGIDISNNFSKSISDLPNDFVDNLDFVITLCEEEVCPAFVGPGKRLHWPQPDPASAAGNDENKREAFRRASEAIKKHLFDFRKLLI